MNKQDLQQPSCNSLQEIQTRRCIEVSQIYKKVCMIKYTASKQKGKPGHCHMAQVFKDGKAFVAVEPTVDEKEASQTAEQIAAYFNSLVVPVPKGS
jgi:hypothetical protein